MATKPPYPNDQRAPEPQHWHLDKKVPISLIIAMLALLGSGINAFYKHERDIDLLYSKYSSLEKSDTSQMEQFKDGMNQIREQYKALNDKLDRLIERQMRMQK